MEVTDQQATDYFDSVGTSYQENWAGYIEAKAKMEEAYKDERMSDRYYTTIELWQPIIYGAMLGKPLKEFLGHFDWTKQTEDGTDGVWVEPPCGSMPEPVMLVCYHAKRLADVECSNELPADALKQFEDRRREMLYGQDALSVIELFEATL